MEDGKEKILNAVDTMTEMMYFRMSEKYDEGYTGWDGQGPNPVTDGEIMGRITDKLAKEKLSPMDYIDIANFAMMGFFKEVNRNC